ncbi:Per1-like protein [Hymenopellis radicata]|nr:Per1-like protein [Hymenopellis radicata]
MRGLNLLLLLGLLGQTYASWGDKNKIFINCLTRCAEVQCDPSIAQPLPLLLRLTFWTCSDDCKYRCMHATTTREVEMGLAVKQYYGKWPFWRMGGIQEPASVAFSLFNLWTHVGGLARIRRDIPEGHPMKLYYVVWAFASMNTWIWSSVFHTRDTSTTEKLDYFSAALTILCALYFTVIRLFHLYPSSRSQLTLTQSTPKGNSNSIRRLWSFICVVTFTCHVSYLTLLPTFDYFYNIVFNAVLGLTHNALWLAYSLPFGPLRRFPGRPKSYRPSFVKKAGILVGCMTAATALELFDFPPLGRIIDAHSLWHLSTALIAPYWYRFLVEDSRDESWHDQRV